MRVIAKIIMATGLFLLLFTNAYSQKRFNAGFVIGVNGTQINGDQMAGFDKGGFFGGIYVDYPLDKQWSAGFEMVFNNKGSKRVFTTDSFGNAVAGPGTWDELDLGYVEVPILAKYKVGKRFEFYAGPTLALLIYSTWIPDKGGEQKADFLKNYDLGLCAGVNYCFAPHFSFTVRYTNSMISFGTGKSNIPGTSYLNTGLLNIVATGGIYYHFFSKY